MEFWILFAKMSGFLSCHAGRHSPTGLTYGTMEPLLSYGEIQHTNQGCAVFCEAHVRCFLLHFVLGFPRV